MLPVWFLAFPAAAGVYLVFNSLAPATRILGALQQERFEPRQAVPAVGPSFRLALLYFLLGLAAGYIWSGIFLVSVVLGALAAGYPFVSRRLGEMRGIQADGKLLLELTQELIRLLEAEPAMHLPDALSVAYNLVRQRDHAVGGVVEGSSLLLGGLQAVVSAANSRRLGLKDTLPEALRKKRPDLVLLVHVLQAGLDQGFDVGPTLRRVAGFLALRQQQSVRARSQYVQAKKMAAGILLLDACVLGLGRIGWSSVWVWYGQGGNWIWLTASVLWVGALLYGTLFFAAATKEA